MINVQYSESEYIQIERIGWVKWGRCLEPEKVMNEWNGVNLLM